MKEERKRNYRDSKPEKDDEFNKLKHKLNKQLKAKAEPQD
jgi:hypothetical protein